MPTLRSGLTLIAIVLAFSVTFDRAPRAGGGAVFPSATTVVMVTLDGVRLQEIIDGPDPALVGDVAAPPGPGMPYLAGTLSRQGTFLGSPEVGGEMETGHPAAISLPSYQALFVGRPTLCASNECAMPWSESLLDRLSGPLGVSRDGIAVYATWTGICRGVAEKASVDAVCGSDAVAARWRERIAPKQADPQAAPPDSTDRAAFELALARLRDRTPAFLYLALDESDAYAHAGDYAGHLSTLRRYDAWLRELDEVIHGLEGRGHQVLLVVTTDHGRGSGAEWSEHGWRVEGSERIWLFARGTGVAAQGAIAGSRAYSLPDVRPTIEHWIGVEPTTGLLHGRVIRAIFTARDDPA